ncbi:hypothetical protein VKT23_007753 [Stygiomarasmius scandens]|uniref:Uncharacterized protein n=1 Tax=Marasmiellus scandens TaxID=2682957 RepID=A0ABR1JIB3_9AGAR
MLLSGQGPLFFTTSFIGCVGITTGSDLDAGGFQPVDPNGKSSGSVVLVAPSTPGTFHLVARSLPDHSSLGGSNNIQALASGDDNTDTNDSSTIESPVLKPTPTQSLVPITNQQATSRQNSQQTTLQQTTPQQPVPESTNLASTTSTSIQSTSEVPSTADKTGALAAQAGNSTSTLSSDASPSNKGVQKVKVNGDGDGGNSGEQGGGQEGEGDDGEKGSDGLGNFPSSTNAINATPTSNSNQSHKSNHLILVLALTFGILSPIILIIFLLFLYRRYRKRKRVPDDRSDWSSYLEYSNKYRQSFSKYSIWNRNSIGPSNSISQANIRAMQKRPSTPSTAVSTECSEDTASSVTLRSEEEGYRMEKKVDEKE